MLEAIITQYGAIKKLTAGDFRWLKWFSPIGGCPMFRNFWNKCLKAFFNSFRVICILEAYNKINIHVLGMVCV